MTLLLLVTACARPVEVSVERRPLDDRATEAGPPEEPTEPTEPTPTEPTEPTPTEPAPDEPTPEEPTPTEPTPEESTPAAFTGAACDDDDGCLLAADGGFCLSAAEGFVGGTCSISCTRTCEDAVGSPMTFCVDDPAAADGAGSDSDDGVCVSRCDAARFPGSGCRVGYGCVDRARHGEPSTVRAVCWPDGVGYDDDVTPTPTPTPPDDGSNGDSADDGVCTADDLPTPNAGVAEEDGLGGCPPGMAPVAGTAGPFCMDRWEAFLELEAGGSVVAFSPFDHPGARTVIARSARGAVPQGYISGREAEGACQAAGKRLCSDSEWLRACRGASTTTYPYGNTRQPGVCNDARSRHPAVEYFGTGDSWIWSELGHPCINQLADSLDRSGDNAGCVDDEGTHFDLMGNLHEWTHDPDGTFRGGFYADTRQNGEGCLYRTSAHDRGHWDYSTGFRCCSDL